MATSETKISGRDPTHQCDSREVTSENSHRAQCFVRCADSTRYQRQRGLLGDRRLHAQVRRYPHGIKGSKWAGLRSIEKLGPRIFGYLVGSLYRARRTFALSGGERLQVPSSLACGRFLSRPFLLVLAVCGPQENGKLSHYTLSHKRAHPALAVTNLTTSARNLRELLGLFNMRLSLIAHVQNPPGTPFCICR